MNILLTSNSQYIKYSLVLLNSIYKNNEQEHISVYYLNSDFSKDDCETLSTFCKNHNSEIHIINVDKNKYNGLPTTDYWTVQCYYILLAHLYLPKNLDRILYLDIDIICNGNLSELYNMDFDGKYLIAASKNPQKFGEKDFCFDLKYAAKFGPYFNSGVVLFNLTAFRDNNITIDTYLSKLQLVPDVTPMADQGLLNLTFCQNCKYIDGHKYNYNYGWTYFEDTEPKFDDSIKLIHFTNALIAFKPWDFVLTAEEIKQNFVHASKTKEVLIYDDFANNLALIWWKYAIDTPYYDQIYSHMLNQKPLITRDLFRIMSTLNSKIEENQRYKITHASKSYKTYLSLVTKYRKFRSLFMFKK